MRSVVVLLSFLGAAVLQAAPQSGTKGRIGEPIDKFRLRDSRGTWHSLDDLKKSKLVVVAFLGTECPVAARYISRLAELVKEFGPKGVAFLGVDANRQDSITQMARLVKDHQISFPLLKDVGNVVADGGAARPLVCHLPLALAGLCRVLPTPPANRV